MVELVSSKTSKCVSTIWSKIVPIINQTAIFRIYITIAKFTLCCLSQYNEIQCIDIDQIKYFMSHIEINY